MLEHISNQYKFFSDLDLQAITSLPEGVSTVVSMACFHNFIRVHVFY